MSDWTKPHSEAFIEKHIDKLSEEDWSLICANQKLSESFREKHADKLDWFYVYWRQSVSHEFFEKHRESLLTGKCTELAAAMPDNKQESSDQLYASLKDLSDQLCLAALMNKYLDASLKTAEEVEAKCKEDASEQQKPACSCCCSGTETPNEDTDQAESKGTLKKGLYVFACLCIIILGFVVGCLLCYTSPEYIKVVLLTVAILVGSWLLYLQYM